MNIKTLINKETISYIFFGVLTTLVDKITFFICYNICSVHWFAATVIGWVLAVAFAYVTNKIWVFESKTRKIGEIMREITAFVSARVVSLLFTLVFMFICERILKLFAADEKITELGMLAANYSSAVFVVIMNYFFSKLFIFKKK